jgi:flagella basal body P-ring formation protein FlgA
MTRIVIAFVLLVGLGCEAGAQSAPATAPKLKELVTVTSELVRIGDLVENAGTAADTPVFRAPDLGETGSVPVSRVADALRPYDIANLDTAGLTEVVVTRAARDITRKDIDERITRAFAGQYGFGQADNLAVILDRDIRVLHVEATATADLAVSRMNLDPRNGRFDISFELPGSMAARRLPLRFTGTISETLEATTLLRAVRAGETIKASDVATERRPRADVGNETISVDQAVGMAAKHALRAGQALRTGDLIKPQVVQRNEAITLTYEVPGILLTVRGKALEAGAVGDIIGVLNIQSNRTIQATVTGPGRVAIDSIKPVTASSAAVSAPATTDLASNESVSRRTQ